MHSDDQQIIKKYDRVRLRPISSIMPENTVIKERFYETDVLEVYGTELLKLTMPKGVLDLVTLSLDTIYEITILSDDLLYHGKGRVEERFRDESGNVCLFRFTDSLAKEQPKNFLNAEKQIMGKVISKDDSDPTEVLITNIGVDRLKIQTEQYLPEDKKMILTFSPEGSKEYRVSVSVQETVRLRTGKCETTLLVENMDLKQQKELAVWILRQTA